MKKRLLSLLLALVMVLSLCSTAFAAEGTDNFKQINTYADGQFTDVSAGHWFAPTVKRAYELGLMKGTGDGTTFSPNGNITIAETLALACRLHSTYYGNGAQFVQGSLWYQVYVDYAIANGIITTGQYASYTAKATRVDFVTILAASLPTEALPAINTLDDGIIPDIPSDATYYEDAYRMYRAGILQGSDNYGTFKPDSNIMRSEVATIVVRMAAPSQRKAVTLAYPPETTAENMQGIWRSASGDIEVIFNGNHFTYAEKREYYDPNAYHTSTHSFLQGIVGEDVKQIIHYYNLAYDEDFCDNRVYGGTLDFICLGNVIWTNYGNAFLYKMTSAELTEEVRAVIGEENIIPAEFLKVSSITSIHMGESFQVVDASAGEDYYWEEATTCYATINGKDYRLDSEMLKWTSSNPSVAEAGQGFWVGAIAVQSNGSTTVTAEYNGLQARADIVIINCVPVRHISDARALNGSGHHAFIFSLTDANNNRLARDCQVALRIVNDNGETVYQTTSPKNVWASFGYNGYFGEWTRNGEKVLHGSLYIYDEEILPGTISTGKLYYQISDSYGGVFFKAPEYSVSISGLPLKDSSLVFELVAGQAGEYGELFTINKDTESEETYYIYHIPAGTYTVTNTGKYMAGLFIYSDEIVVNSSGWEEPAECLFGEVLAVEGTATITIEDGYFIEIHEPARFTFELVNQRS